MSIKISITGDLASGKSTLSKHLSHDLGIELISAGEYFRSKGGENESVLESNQSPLKAAFIDDAVDAYVASRTRDLDAQDQSYIVDARIGFHYVQDSLKIKLIANPNIAADRALKADRKTEPYKTFEDAFSGLQARRTVERDRFLTRYGVDVFDLDNFDLVIDTSFIQKQHTVEIVKMVLQAQGENKAYPKFWCHPGQLIAGNQNSSDYREYKALDMLHVMSEEEFDFLQGLNVILTDNRDILVEDGHHRTLASNILSLPYIGANVKTVDELPELRHIANCMYDYYEAINYHARLYVEQHPDFVPIWGEYKQGSNDAALNKYKFNFAERALGLPIPSRHTSPSP